MSLSIPIGLLIGFWFLAMCACGASIWWSLRGTSNRSMAIWLLGLLPILVGVLGLARFSFVASSTTNGVVQWRFDSAWLFWMMVGCGFLACGCAVYRRLAGPSVESSAVVR